MEDLSLHILDIVENSIKADAKEIEIKIVMDKKDNILSLEIIDDGKGLRDYEVQNIFDPFYTSDRSKKTGLGLPLLMESVTKTSGKIDVQSGPGKGTKIVANFKLSHPDMIPLGEIDKTLFVLTMGHRNIRFKFQHYYDGSYFYFDTNELDAKEEDNLEYLRSVREKLESYKNFLGTIKGDLYGV